MADRTPDHLVHVPQPCAGGLSHAHAVARVAWISIEMHGIATKKIEFCLLIEFVTACCEYDSVARTHLAGLTLNIHLHAADTPSVASSRCAAQDQAMSTSACRRTAESRPSN